MADTANKLTKLLYEVLETYESTSNSKLQFLIKNLKASISNYGMDKHARIAFMIDRYLEKIPNIENDLKYHLKEMLEIVEPKIIGFYNLNGKS
jgi:hypothetical protein